MNNCPLTLEVLNPLSQLEKLEQVLKFYVHFLSERSPLQLIVSLPSLFIPIFCIEVQHQIHRIALVVHPYILHRATILNIHKTVKSIIVEVTPELMM